MTSDEGIEVMKQLGIREKDLDDVVFEAEGSPPAKVTCWMEIASVYGRGLNPLDVQESESCMGSSIGGEI